LCKNKNLATLPCPHLKTAWFIAIGLHQAAEVMLFTVDKVNAMQVLPPPLKLGAYLLDDCDKDTYGLQQAVDFIKGNLTNQSDHIVRIFAHWAIVFFGHIFENYSSSANFWATSVLYKT
jgi:hypothetical protein